MEEDARKKQMKDQMKQLVDGAEQSNARARKAREDFERFVERVLQTLKLDSGSALGQTLRMDFETAYTYGSTAGESAETNLVYVEQLELIRKMSELHERREKEISVREKEQRERDLKMLAFTERQVAAVEALAIAVGGKIKAKRPRAGRR
jgi:hypothetical protein